MKNLISLFLLCFSFTAIIAKQSLSLMGGGEYKHPLDQCISEENHQAIQARLEQSKQDLYRKKMLPLPKKVRSVPLQWPLQQATGFNYCSYYGISNFVDHNVGYPNQLQDYNCGTRTYDLSTGYNHQGTDIFLWPFSWNMVNAEQVEVIAAAPGTIIGKDDGNPHTNCDFSNPNWNAVYIQHIDGSVAWYGHMKNGSLTSKPIGATVVAGEKLGLVASSGSSTGPHLHFELYNAANQLTDPYQGPCNTGSSWWTTQKPYYEGTVNAAFTHSAPPVFNACPNPDVTNIDVNFQPGNVVYFVGYYHDQINGSTATYTINRPDNSVYTTWTQTFNVYYSASYWYWYMTLPSNAPAGVWNFSITYQGQTCNQPFQVGGNFPLSLSDLRISAMEKEDRNMLYWSLKEDNKEVDFFEIEKSEDGIHFNRFDKIPVSDQLEWQVEDITPSELCYYRIQVHYKDYSTQYSNIVSIQRKHTQRFSFYPNPAHSMVYFLNASDQEKLLMNVFGQVVLRTGANNMNVTALLPGLYFLRCGGNTERLSIE